MQIMYSENNTIKLETHKIQLGNPKTLEDLTAHF